MKYTSLPFQPGACRWPRRSPGPWSIPLDLIIVRKIQLPWTTEAGFGALDPAGQAILNEDLLRRMPLSPEEIEAQVKKTAAVMRQREERLRGGKPYARLDGQTALVVDDGLASGYTMRAALQFLKAQGAARLIVAVPTGSERTVWDLLPLVDELYCLNVRGGFSFAVADAYENWYDLTEEEVLASWAPSDASAVAPGRSRMPPSGSSINEPSDHFFQPYALPMTLASMSPNRSGPDSPGPPGL